MELAGDIAVIANGQFVDGRARPPIPDRLVIAYGVA
jgi:hypothetical protein